MRILLVGLVFAISLMGADITGTWNGKVETGMGSGEPVLVLKQNGEKLSGTYSGAIGEASLTGTVKGEDVEMAIEVQGAKIVYTAKVAADGKTMQGKVDLAGMASGTFTASKKE